MKRAIFCLITSTLFGAVVEDQSNLKIQTPSLQERQMRKLRLDNGLEAVLISDPHTPSSGAALAVGVGSWQDPKERAGMAHFVEHLLFLGTEKYPDEKAYTRYLDEHGGSRNAFTMSDRTCYMFSVNNEGFSGALDRFAQFFIAPLFSPSGVERECKAIHQEYCKDIPLDAWRALYVKKELANEAHPFHDFCIGNLTTLAKIEQDELKEWYKEHYSAHRMHLVVYSAQSLDSLEEEVTTLFSSVKNNANTLERCEVPLFAHNQTALAAIYPVQAIQQLEMAWEIPRHFGEDQKRHVGKLVSHVLGHEGDSSLLSQLKKEQLAEGVGAGFHRAGEGQGFLTLSVGLTAQGVAQYEKVIERCCQAIASLRGSGIPRYIFDEVVQIEELHYTFQSREDVFDFVADYAVGMVDEPLETFPRQTLIPSVYDENQITAFLQELKPEKALYTLIAPEKINPFKADRNETWLGAAYRLVAVPKQRLEKWRNVEPHPCISIPAPNKFLPENLSVHGEPSGKKGLPAPTLLADTLTAKVYSCTDDRFFVPQVAWRFNFSTPEVKESAPKSQVLADLYCHAVSEKLNTLAYNAAMAGLNFSLSPARNGVVLSIEGYSDKAATLLVSVLEYMQKGTPTKEEFELYKNLAKRDYMNRANASALKQGGEILWNVLYAEHCGMKAKCAVLDTIRYSDLVRFCDRVWNRSYCEAMLYGNHQEEAGHNVVTLLNKHFSKEAYPPHLHPKVETAAIPSTSYFVEQSKLPSNALILTMDLGDFTFEKRAAQEILSKGLEEPFFSELRTRQQTAYLVTNWAQEIERHLYTFFAIQSSTHETRDLLARFELFLENSLQHLKREIIPQERFEAIRTALIEKLEKPAENLVKMGAVLHTLAFDYESDFKWLEKRKEALEELSYDKFVAYAEEFLGKENKRRLAICIDGDLPENQRFRYSLIQTFEKFKNRIEYKGRNCDF
ncbi:MAG: insulinase family protein [Chlamydiales bacterium]|nr:insulinase family protein [Chlamydiales bacterium]